ncbi:MAG: hypothetical protein H7Y03_02375 [Chitinophagaceae bacterium]|nr:hypothetical protein [Chitinophagaceae bacterium]
MKRGFTFLVAFVLFAAIEGNAQIQKGNVLIGADLADINLGLDKGGNFSFLINPKAAWFVRDNIAVGAYLTAGLRTAKDQGTDVNYGVGLLGRYYFSDASLNLLRHSRFFVEGNIGIEGDNPSVGDNTNGLGLGIGPGWTYFITPNIGVEGLLKYNGIVGFGSKPTSNNLNLSFGFQIYLPSRRARAVVEDIKQDIKNPGQ